MRIFAKSGTDPSGLALDDGSPERQRCWAELEDRVVRSVHWLHDTAAVAPGDHVALLMHNRAEAFEAVIAGIAAGVWVTPVNFHLTLEEIEYVLRDSGARVVLCDDAHAEIVRSAVRNGTGERDVRIVRVGDELDRELAGASDAPLDESAPAGGNMIYTSGTTGRPKGVKRSHPPTLGAALAAQRAYADSIRLDGSGPHLVTGPLYHAAPLMFAVYEQQNGAPVIVMPRWDAEQCLRLIDERAVRAAHLVPTMFVRMLRLSESVREASMRPALEVVLHGAAPVAPSVKQQMLDWWGPILLEYWGGTEGGVNTLVDSRDWSAHPGTVGRALPAFEIFAVGDDGNRLGPGQLGTLYCRDTRTARTFEYHGDPDKTDAAYLEPGVFTLGDVGSVDADGWVFLADRKSNMIISGGVNIYPAEIEQALLGHPAVADVGVFGVPDDEWGESVKAAIELVEGCEASQDLEREILDYARERVAGYKVPRSIDFETQLPRHPSGKLYVRRLRDRYWLGRERKI